MLASKTLVYPPPSPLIVVAVSLLNEPVESADPLIFPLANSNPLIKLPLIAVAICEEPDTDGAVLISKPLAGTRVTGLHFVQHQEQIMLITELS